MPTNVYAAMLELDRRDDFQGLDNDSYDAFEDALAQAKVLFDRHAGINDAKLFLAPEYTFSRHQVNARGSVSIGSFTSGEKKDLYKKIAAASGRYNDILVVAGSIAYQKGGGWFSKKKHLAVTPVALNGQIILKHYKKTYDQFQEGSSAASFATKDYGETFSYKGLRFGIEICLDHTAKTLKTALGGQPIDVHLLVSEGASPWAGAIAVGVGKLVVNCDMSGRGQGNGIRAVQRLNQANQPIVDAGATGRVEEVATRQPMGSGAHVVLYSGVVA